MNEDKNVLETVLNTPAKGVVIKPDEARVDVTGDALRDPAVLGAVGGVVTRYAAEGPFTVGTGDLPGGGHVSVVTHVGDPNPIRAEIH